MMEYVIIVQKTTCRTIGTYLNKEEQFSKRLLQKIRYGGEIWQAGEYARLKSPVIVGAQLRIVLPREHKSTSLIPIDKPIEIIYEDEWFLVVNKPQGLLSIPSAVDNTDSLVQRICYYYEQSGNTSSTVHIITRLDKETCGLVLIAKNHMIKQFMHDQKIERHYYACVRGYLAKHRGVITWPISRGMDGIKRYASLDGKYAKTMYYICYTSQKKSMSLLRLKLGTGRTHQIRVHMNKLGNPLIGDSLYNQYEDKKQTLCLQSYYLSFFHPIIERQLHFKLPLAVHLQTACRK